MEKYGAFPARRLKRLRLQPIGIPFGFNIPCDRKLSLAPYDYFVLGLLSFGFLRLRRLFYDINKLNDLLRPASPETP